ncbi:hypothetical protein PLESTM_000747300 [Pleodorina starrii]|nr:hypothetical protein PLESTM_000747300 [Pleodorina starrii]
MVTCSWGQLRKGWGGVGPASPASLPPRRVGQYRGQLVVVVDRAARTHVDGCIFVDGCMLTGSLQRIIEFVSGAGRQSAGCSTAGARQWSRGTGNHTGRVGGLPSPPPPGWVKLDERAAVMAVCRGRIVWGTGAPRRVGGVIGYPDGCMGGSSSSRNEAELPQPLGHGVTSCRAAPPNPTPSPTAAAAKGGDGEAAVAAEAVAAPATADVVLGPRAAAAAAAAATAGASPAVAAWPAPLLSRRRVGRLAAAALLLALSPVPLPIPVPSTGRGLLPLLSFPLSFPAPAAAAAATAAAAEEGEGEEVFGYVAPEPLGGPGAGSGAAAGTSSSSFPSSAAPAPRYFRTLAAAVAECPPGGVVLVAAGRYRERLLLSSERPLTLRAWPKGARVEVVWETQEPYQSTLDISAPANAPANTKTKTGGKVVVEGLTIRHSSKSVANNYGVFIRGGSPLLLDCDISSASGAGVGIEGASPQLVGCRVHDCARQGVAIFGAAALDLDLDLAVDPGMMYGMTGGVVRDCDVYGNALDGVLVRSGASPDLVNNLIHNNGGVGVNLQDCSGRYEGNTVYDNARGSVAVSALFECDPGDLAGSNSLRGLMRRL